MGTLPAWGAASGSSVTTASHTKRESSRERLGWWRVLATALLVAAAAIWVVGFVELLLFLARSNNLGDVSQEYLPAARDVLHGRSPYPPIDSSALDPYRVYVYPPLVAFLSIPLALAPGAVFVATGILVACVPLSLWLFGVRDWRCYVVALLWMPVFNGIRTGNVALLLLLGCAVCWRFRDRPGVVSAAGALTAAAKLLAWPLALWLASTRRLRAAFGLVAVAVGVTLGLWAVLGFAGLADFPRNLHRLQQSDGHTVYTVSTLAWEAGLSPRVQMLLWLSLALLAVAGVVAFGRRGDDARSYSCAMVAAIVASPIVWLHSFAFLLAPVAILRPRLSGVWLLPVAMWVFATGAVHPAPWQMALTLATAGVVVAAALSPDGLASSLLLRTRQDRANGLRVPSVRRRIESSPIEG